MIELGGGVTNHFWEIIKKNATGPLSCDSSIHLIFLQRKFLKPISLLFYYLLLVSLRGVFP
jgi:hypothetical protein